MTNIDHLFKDSLSWLRSHMLWIYARQLFLASIPMLVWMLLGFFCGVLPSIGFFMIWSGVLLGVYDFVAKREAYELVVKLTGSPEAANLIVGKFRLHNYKTNGNYAGYNSSSDPLSNSSLGEMIYGLFNVYVKTIGFFFKLSFYYMPKYHTKMFIVFLLAIAALVTIHSPQVDKWNSDSQWALAPTDLKPLPTSFFGIASQKPEIVYWSKKPLFISDLDNKALFGLYKMNGFESINKPVLRERLLKLEPEPVFNNNSEFAKKLPHREELTEQELDEFTKLSCQYAEQFTRLDNFPKMSKANQSKVILERALMSFNKDCNDDKYPIRTVEGSLKSSQSNLASDELDYLKKIQSSLVFMFDKYKEDASGLLTIFLGILLAWVAYRRDYGKEKKAEPANESPAYNPADFSAKKY